MINQQKQIGGQPFHIRDCYVWAEIYYLDSSTDYREYLPAGSVRPPTVSQSDFVSLDASGNWPDFGILTRWTVPAALVLIFCAFLYFLLSVYM